MDNQNQKFSRDQVKIISPSKQMLALQNEDIQFFVKHYGNTQDKFTENRMRQLEENTKYFMNQVQPLLEENFRLKDMIINLSQAVNYSQELVIDVVRKVDSYGESRQMALQLASMEQLTQFIREDKNYDDNFILQINEESTQFKQKIREMEKYISTLIQQNAVYEKQKDEEFETRIKDYKTRDDELVNQSRQLQQEVVDHQTVQDNLNGMISKIDKQVQFLQAQIVELKKQVDEGQRNLVMQDRKAMLDKQEIIKKFHEEIRMNKSESMRELGDQKSRFLIKITELSDEMKNKNDRLEEVTIQLNDEMRKSGWEIQQLQLDYKTICAQYEQLKLTELGQLDKLAKTMIDKREKETQLSEVEDQFSLMSEEYRQYKVRMVDNQYKYDQTEAKYKQQLLASNEQFKQKLNVVVTENKQQTDTSLKKHIYEIQRIKQENDDEQSQVNLRKAVQIEELTKQKEDLFNLIQDQVSDMKAQDDVWNFKYVTMEVKLSRQIGDIESSSKSEIRDQERKLTTQSINKIEELTNQFTLQISTLNIELSDVKLATSNQLKNLEEQQIQQVQQQRILFNQLQEDNTTLQQNTSEQFQNAKQEISSLQSKIRTLSMIHADEVSQHETLHNDKLQKSQKVMNNKLLTMKDEHQNQIYNLQQQFEEQQQKIRMIHEEDIQQLRDLDQNLIYQAKQQELELELSILQDKYLDSEQTIIKLIQQIKDLELIIEESHQKFLSQVQNKPQKIQLQPLAAGDQNTINGQISGKNSIQNSSENSKNKTGRNTTPDQNMSEIKAKNIREKSRSFVRKVPVQATPKNKTSNSFQIEAQKTCKTQDQEMNFSSVIYNLHHHTETQPIDLPVKNQRTLPISLVQTRVQTPEQIMLISLKGIEPTLSDQDYDLSQYSPAEKRNLELYTPTPAFGQINLPQSQGASSVNSYDLFDNQAIVEKIQDQHDQKQTQRVNQQITNQESNTLTDTKFEILPIDQNQFYNDMIKEDNKSNHAQNELFNDESTIRYDKIKQENLYLRRLIQQLQANKAQLDNDQQIQELQQQMQTKDDIIGQLTKHYEKQFNERFVVGDQMEQQLLKHKQNQPVIIEERSQHVIQTEDFKQVITVKKDIEDLNPKQYMRNYWSSQVPTRAKLSLADEFKKFNYEQDILNQTNINIDHMDPRIGLRSSNQQRSKGNTFEKRRKQTSVEVSQAQQLIRIEGLANHSYKQSEKIKNPKAIEFLRKKRDEEQPKPYPIVQRGTSTEELPCLYITKVISGFIG